MSEFRKLKLRKIRSIYSEYCKDFAKHRNLVKFRWIPRCKRAYENQTHIMERYIERSNGQNTSGLWDTKRDTFTPDPEYLLRLESKRASKIAQETARIEQILLENIPQTIQNKPYQFGSLVRVDPKFMNIKTDTNYISYENGLPTE